MYYFKNKNIKKNYSKNPKKTTPKKFKKKEKKIKDTNDKKILKKTPSVTAIKGNKGDIGVPCQKWNIIKQLGKSGKEGTTFEVEHIDTKVRAAMKQFKDNKSTKTFDKEVEM